MLTLSYLEQATAGFIVKKDYASVYIMSYEAAQEGNVIFLDGLYFGDSFISSRPQDEREQVLSVIASILLAQDKYVAADKFYDAAGCPGLAAMIYKVNLERNSR